MRKPILIREWKREHGTTDGYDQYIVDSYNDPDFDDSLVDVLMGFWGVAAVAGWGERCPSCNHEPEHTIVVIKDTREGTDGVPVYVCPKCGCYYGHYSSHAVTLRVVPNTWSGNDTDVENWRSYDLTWQGAINPNTNKGRRHGWINKEDGKVVQTG